MKKEKISVPSGLSDILKLVKKSGSSLSSSEIEEIISELQKTKWAAKKIEEKYRQNAAPIQEPTRMDLPTDWNNLFDSDNRARGIHADTISDGLILSLTTLGKVDIEYISSVTGADIKSVISALKGSIYQNPLTWNECFYKGWETAEEYLSGNLMCKLRAAEAANKIFCGYFNDNINAIKNILPPSIATEDIYITLGSPWVPAEIIDDFIIYLFGEPFQNVIGLDNETVSEYSKTIHDELTGTWEIPNKWRYNHSIGVRQNFGTDKQEALHILQKTLNMKTVSVMKTVSCSGIASGEKRILDEEETIAAIEKQQKLIKAFQDWVWTDDTRKKRLKAIFENQFACVRRRIFDGSFLDFPTMSKEVSLYPYQKNAVARILFTPNTLLAHDVGLGKTYVMIAAGQELRRMGLSQKNMYVVPNHIVGQWKSIFETLYPNAKLLCVEPKNFTPAKRLKMLECIRDQDFDGIIIAYSCFEQIPLSREYYKEELHAKIAQVSALMTQKSKATSALRKKKEALEKDLSEMARAAEELYDTIYFDELGITRLFVDEAHNFKNCPLETKATNVLGINAKGSKRCQDMMDKVHMIQKKNNGKGVVFATGTPITNSITDVYIMQKYLQSGELELLELQSFDAWVGMFAEKSAEFEIDIDTNSFHLATRFSVFHNLPELTSLLSSIADFHQVSAADGIPQLDGYTDVLVTKTADFSAYLDDISRRADDVRKNRVNRKEDNLLKITTDGRKAALDLRLVDHTAAFSPHSKVARCAENAANIYFETNADNGTQLIFCDTSVPKAGFNIYDELKAGMTALGIPGSRIAFIHDAETEAMRTQLFQKVRSGDIRILIGSTFKLGLGVNVQDRLVALHHLDVPWRPADMAQREGRILRPGNRNPYVKIYRYITEGSFDAYSWQLLETKQRFIADLLSGSLTARSGTDIADTVLDYAEVKALAVGNPLIKKRVEAANKLTMYLTLQHKLVESRICMKRELLELPGEIAYQRELIQRCMEDAAFYQNRKKDEAEDRNALRESIFSAVQSHILESKQKTLMSYRGFDIILPANMTVQKPYIYLSRQGQYSVELGDTSIGVLIRIDNFLNSFEVYLRKLKLGLTKLLSRETETKAELAKDENYSDEIVKCKMEIESIDKELGVKKL